MKMQVPKINLPKHLLNRFLPFWSLVRATPAMIPFAGIVMMILSPSVMAGGLTAGAFISMLLNYVFKFIFKAGHYELTGGYKGLSLLGHGPRPAGAKGTGAFLEHPTLKPGTSWGMPSGHSQLAWYAFGFLVGYVFIWRPYMFSTAHKIVAGLLGLLFAVTVSFSRVWVDGVHTWDQSLVGAFLGFILGLITLVVTRFIARKYWNEQFENEETGDGGMDSENGGMDSETGAMTSETGEMPGEIIDMAADNEKAAEMAQNAAKEVDNSEQALNASKNEANNLSGKNMNKKSTKTTMQASSNNK